MSKEATFHRYLQYHSAGRRLLVDTCTLKTKKPSFYAKNLAFMPKIKNLASMPTKQNLVFKKLGFYATKPGFHAKQTKDWLPCHKQKIGSHATNKILAPMPQNLALMPKKKKFGSRATKPKLGFHATKISSYAKNWLPCNKQNFGSYATNIRLSCHSKLAFMPSQKSGCLPQNQAFRHKIWPSYPKQPFDKRFSQNDNLLIKFSNKHSNPTFTYFHKKEFK